MADLPEPLVPADCDLRGMPYMPLFGDRLFGSATWIAASADAKVAALRLWYRSFAHEVPAASLPDNDTLLADYAGYGVGIKAWQKVRPQAMRGWILCSDGRLYHRTVAEAASEAWTQRLRNREKQEKWRSKNRRVTTPVTVTDGVTKPLDNAGREGKGREGTLSEPNGSGATPPTKPRDITAIVFDDGLKWLQERTAKPEGTCRNLLGRWRKSLGDAELLAAIGRAQREGIIDPVPWFERAIQNHERDRARPKGGGFNL